jgi:hypothetical protein
MIALHIIDDSFHGNTTQKDYTDVSKIVAAFIGP